MNAMTSAALGAVLAAAIGIGAPARLALAQAPSSDRQTELAEGKHIFRKECAGCHKWHGNGGGGYGGAALSLRDTRLNRAQIIETIGCGRPGTGMPYHLRDAYDSDKCYGLTRKQLGKMMPIEAPIFLRPREIAAVTDYVLAKVRGKGAPTYAQCIDFFGAGSRVCDVYQAKRRPGAGAAAAK